MSACLFVSLLFLFISESLTRDGKYVETYIKSTAVSGHSPMNKFAIKASDSNNDRILTGEELNQEPNAKPDGIAMNSKAHMNKEEEDASTAEEGVILDTEGKRMSSEYQRIQSPYFFTKGGSKLIIHGTIESNAAGKFKCETACRNVLIYNKHTSSSFKLE